jgi:hypothetical protein
MDVSKQTWKILSFDRIRKEMHDLLAAAVQLMAFMIEAFPGHMQDAFEDEPGFEIVLKEAWRAVSSLT